MTPHMKPRLSLKNNIEPIILDSREEHESEVVREAKQRYTN